MSVLISAKSKSNFPLSVTSSAKVSVSSTFGAAKGRAVAAKAAALKGLTFFIDQSNNGLPSFGAFNNILFIISPLRKPAPGALAKGPIPRPHEPRPASTAALPTGLLTIFLIGLVTALTTLPKK